MPSFINTNMASLNTQNNLTKSQGALNTSIQRLSSGMRVNSAKDDAAGMAIANRMDSSIRGNTVAMRNANDAISFSQTAEGALSKINDNLQRMRELAVQSANGSNGEDDRVLLQTEFAQLQSENGRIKNNTRFNNIDVLASGTTKFQIGDGTSSDDTINITNDNLANLALSGVTTTVAAGVGTNTAAGATAIRIDQSAAITAAGGANGTAAVAAKTGQQNATDALTAIDAAIKEVNVQQIKHGANQNRFTAVIATLQTAVENQTTARSRIMDTDYAAETAHLARSQILQQAGMAMLAQANQLPNGVMGLLR